MMDPGAISPVDRYWVFATEGDMSLLLGDSSKAAGYYAAGLDELPEGNDGVVQSSYVQLCRLYRALGAVKLRPVLKVFSDTKKFKIKAGPLGDCGRLFSGGRM
jgi:hypothetical protein